MAPPPYSNLESDSVVHMLPFLILRLLSLPQKIHSGGGGMYFSVDDLRFGRDVEGSASRKADA